MFKWLSNLFNGGLKEESLLLKNKDQQTSNTAEPVAPAKAEPESLKETTSPVVEAPVVESKPKRARSKGKFKADDKATSTVNEAWVEGKAPAKKVKKPKVEKTAPAMKVSKPRSKKTSQN